MGFYGSTSRYGDETTFNGCSWDYRFYKPNGIYMDVTNNLMGKL